MEESESPLSGCAGILMAIIVSLILWALIAHTVKNGSDILNTGSSAPTSCVIQNTTMMVCGPVSS